MHRQLVHEFIDLDGLGYIAEESCLQALSTSSGMALALRATTGYAP